MTSELDSLAEQLQRRLRERGHVIVFAESCTAGLIASTLGRLPGISSHLAGSAVVYQIATKVEWLGVDEKTLRDPGPVSELVSEQMARGVLRKTPHATMAASVTGHLGPDAPFDEDGTAWCTVAIRDNAGVTTTSRHFTLDTEDGIRHLPSLSPIERRHRRQIEAASGVLRCCMDRLS